MLKFEDCGRSVGSPSSWWTSRWSTPSTQLSLFFRPSCLGPRTPPGPPPSLRSWRRTSPPGAAPPLGGQPGASCAIGSLPLTGILGPTLQTCHQTQGHHSGQLQPALITDIGSFSSRDFQTSEGSGKGAQGNCLLIDRVQTVLDQVRLDS